MLVIVGSRIWEICFKRTVGIGSKSQLVSRDWDRSLETLSLVTQVKDEKLGGVNGGGKWRDIEIRLISRLVWRLWILSEKNLANDWDNISGNIHIFQRWWGLVELVEMTEELLVHLAFIMATWWMISGSPQVFKILRRMSTRPDTFKISCFSMVYCFAVHHLLHSPSGTLAIQKYTLNLVFQPRF